MKKFIIICFILIILFVIWDILYYRVGIYIDFNPNKEISTFTKTEGKNIYVKKNGNYETFEIKGVNLGVGIPGHYATDYAIDKETYLRWFKQIKELGANTIRVYTILQDDFYNAIYEFNKDNPDPLYVIHGLWVNDYVLFSEKDAYDEEFLEKMLEDVKILSDVIHGNKKISFNQEYGNGNYTKDISQWVIGYILGVEWEDVTVAYTNDIEQDKKSYNGKYMYTKENATPFEAMLARVGDKMLEYESNRYKEQRLIAFSNWPTTDPLSYLEIVENYFLKVANVDVENIGITDEVKSGYFASYHVYPYYPDYLSYYANVEDFKDDDGNINTYREYLKRINNYHTIPVVISEFGLPSSRGITQIDKYTGRNQGGLSEKEQGEGIVQCYKDIKAANCAGGIVFTWQDEWFKRTWNTMHAVDLTKTPYWSDYQTNEQFFGLLSFDPGNEKSICYVDGISSDWKEEEFAREDENGKLYMKYDEKFIYFMVDKEGLNINSKIYIPIDTTNKSGSTYCENYDLKFNQNVDFVIAIDGIDNSRVVVQERYEQARALFNREINSESPYNHIPYYETPIFKNINLILKRSDSVTGKDNATAETYETGKLTYGNANPESEEFNSLADFCINGNILEIKIPWQLLNFSNPSEMKIHDDYYENYGVEEIQIDNMNVGLILEENKHKRADLSAVELKGWGKNVTYHERLKESYYILQQEWNKKK